MSQISEAAKQACSKKIDAFRSDVKEWYKKEVETEKNMASPKDGKSGTNIWNIDPSPAIDSMRVVSVSIYVEKHLGFELPVELIKEGGYANIDEMLDDLSPKLEKVYFAKPAQLELNKKKEEVTSQ